MQGGQALQSGFSMPVTVPVAQNTGFTDGTTLLASPQSVSPRPPSHPALLTLEQGGPQFQQSEPSPGPAPHPALPASPAPPHTAIKRGPSPELSLQQLGSRGNLRVVIPQQQGRPGQQDQDHQVGQRYTSTALHVSNNKVGGNKFAKLSTLSG